MNNFVWIFKFLQMPLSQLYFPGQSGSSLFLFSYNMRSLSGSPGFVNTGAEPAPAPLSPQWGGVWTPILPCGYTLYKQDTTTVLVPHSSLPGGYAQLGGVTFPP
jgi:hypothetical protein